MRILMIAPQPFFTPRGTPLSVLHRIYALSKLGHQIDLVTYHLGETIPFENVNYYRIPNIPFIKRISVGPSKRKVIVDFFIFFILKKMKKRTMFTINRDYFCSIFFYLFSYYFTRYYQSLFICQSNFFSAPYSRY